MRNCDKIKALEHEVGRYQKKVADDAHELKKLRVLLDQARIGNQETQILVDAILTAVTLQCGVEEKDPDDESKILGKSLVIQQFDALGLRNKYEIHARFDTIRQEYVIGVVERDAPAE